LTFASSVKQPRISTLSKAKLVLASPPKSILEAAMRDAIGLALKSAAFLSVLALSGLFALADDSPGKWSVAAQMTTTRTEILADAYKGKIYVAGGEALGRQDSPLFQEFNPKTGSWRDLARMPIGASHVGLAALNGKIYVAGGFTANVHKNPLDQFIEYDIATGKWRNLAPLSSPRGSISLVAFRGKIHAIGGRGPDGMTIATRNLRSGRGTMDEGGSPARRARSFGSHRGQGWAPRLRRAHQCHGRQCRAARCL
jgi:hypothetical protein